MSTVQATPAAVYNENVIATTKDEQREEAEMNPADRQSKRGTCIVVDSVYLTNLQLYKKTTFPLILNPESRTLT